MLILWLINDFVILLYMHKCIIHIKILIITYYFLVHIKWCIIFSIKSYKPQILILYFFFRRILTNFISLLLYSNILLLGPYQMMHINFNKVEQNHKDFFNTFSCTRFFHFFLVLLYSWFCIYDLCINSGLYKFVCNKFPDNQTVVLPQTLNLQMKIIAINEIFGQRPDWLLHHMLGPNWSTFCILHDDSDEDFWTLGSFYWGGQCHPWNSLGKLPHLFNGPVEE